MKNATLANSPPDFPGILKREFYNVPCGLVCVGGAGGG